MLHLYRCVKKEELNRIQNGEVISNHRVAIPEYSKELGGKGVFTFPRINKKKHAFFLVSPGGITSYVVRLKVPEERVIITGAGEYGNNYQFPEVIISEYSIRDVIEIIPIKELRDTIVLESYWGYDPDGEEELKHVVMHKR